MSAPAGQQAPPELPAAGDHEVDIDGQVFLLPQVSARTWLDAVVYAPPGCWWQLFPGQLAEPEQEHLIHRLRDPGDPFDVDDIETVALEALGAVLGMDFWAGRRLLLFVRGAWMEFDGWCVEKGVEPLGLPAYRLANAAWSLRLQGCEDKKARYKLYSEVFAPPDGNRWSGRAWADDPRFTRARDEFESAMFMEALQGRRR